MEKRHSCASCPHAVTRGKACRNCEHLFDLAELEFEYVLEREIRDECFWPEAEDDLLTIFSQEVFC